MAERPHGRMTQGAAWPGASRLALALAALWVAGGVLWLVTGMAWLVSVGLIALPAGVLGLLAVVLRELHHLRVELEATPISEPPVTASPVAPAPAVSAPPPATPKPQPAPPVPLPLEDEPGLGLATPPDDAPVDRADLVRALHFPEDEDDGEGFASLRRALGNRRARQLIQAAQDVLTLLSQDGIYTDDLTPDHTRPEIWRRFAQGARGHQVAQLGAIHERAALGSVMARMREDMIFRDTAHHFLRLFDRILADFEPEASDEELVALSTTRTARAFMLLGRAAGVFG